MNVSPTRLPKVLGDLAAREHISDAVVAAKRARRETAIGRGTTSLAHAAVDMAARRVGWLEGKRILLLGAGEVGESMALAVAGIQGAQVFVANRTWDRAVALAARI